MSLCFELGIIQCYDKIRFSNIHILEKYTFKAQTVKVTNNYCNLL